AIARGADQPVGIAEADRGDAAGALGRPAGAIADTLAGGEVAYLDDRRLQPDDGTRRGEGPAAIEADAGPGEVAAELGAEQHPGGGRERSRAPKPLRQPPELGKLSTVERV